LASDNQQVKRIALNIGDVAVSTTPSVLETILGSCVAICLWDAKRKVAGMNHFMMPYMTDTLKDPMLCGPESIRALIAKVVSMGSDINELKAKVFGGGNVVELLNSGTQIGKENVRAAKETLADYNIPVIKEFTGNDFGIKVFFYSDSGRAFVKRLNINKCAQCACKINI
jgi:chemotaxis protein CheD